MDDFNEERRKFLIEFFEERADCDPVDLIIALQRYVHSFEDLEFFLDRYDEWNIVGGGQNVTAVLHDQFDEKKYHIGDEIEIEVEGNLTKAYYIGRIPVAGIKGINGKRPAFICQEIPALIYMLQNANGHRSFSFLFF